MAGEIYFNNLSGKFDWGSIIDQIIQIKSLPIQRLSQEAKRLQTIQSALSKLAQAVKDFSSFIESMDVETALRAKKAVSSDESVLSATVSENIPDITLRIQVQQLSQKEVMLSNFSTPTQNANISWNTFTLRFARDYGDYEEFTIQAGSGTLADLVNRINQVAGSKILASQYFDGSGYRLMLTEKRETDSRLETDPSTSTFVISEATAMNINGVWGLQYASPLQYARNARVRVGDSSSVVESPSNTIENLVHGLTVNLKRVGESVVTVTSDPSRVNSLLGEFVKRYNSVISEVNALTAKDAPFQGDYTVTGIKTSLSRMLDNLFRYDLVNIKEDGTLEVNSSGVNSLYNSDRAKLQEILGQLKESMGRYLRRTSMDMDRFSENYQSRLDAIKENIERIKLQIVREEERLRLEYARVEAFINRSQEIMERLRAFIVTLSEMQRGKK